MFSFIEFIIKNYIEAVITSLIAIICLIGGYVVYASAFRKGDDKDHEGDIKKIEEAIERLLEAQEANPVASGAEGHSIEGAEALSQELEQKKKEIEELKANSSEDNTSELLQKIRSLEDRLAEYEIIEDDIADLSKFKEENARLKRQLESVSTGSEVPAEEEVFSLEEKSEAKPEQKMAEDVVPELETEQAEAPSEAIEEDPKVAAALDALGAEVIAEAAPEVDPAEEAVEIPVAETPKASPAPQASAEIKAAAEAEANSIAADEAKEEISVPEATDNVLGEFADTSEDEESDPLAALGDIDTNKMLEEIQGLSDEAEASADVLQQKTDIEKLAEEASVAGSDS